MNNAKLTIERQPKKSSANGSGRMLSCKIMSFHSTSDDISVSASANIAASAKVVRLYTCLGMVTTSACDA
jgi:hypothetical protein